MAPATEVSRDYTLLQRHPTEGSLCSFLMLFQPSQRSLKLLLWVFSAHPSPLILERRRQRLLIITMLTSQLAQLPSIARGVENVIREWEPNVLIRLQGLMQVVLGHRRVAQYACEDVRVLAGKCQRLKRSRWARHTSIA